VAQHVGSRSAPKRANRWQNEQHRGERTGGVRQLPRHRPQAFDLIAAMLAVQAPFGEVLAVVGEETIRVFTETRARTTDDFRALESGSLTRPHPDGEAVSEPRKRNLFHRATPPARTEGTVVDDAAIADVDAVMGEAETRRDEMRAQRGLFVARQKSIVLLFACARH